MRRGESKIRSRQGAVRNIANFAKAQTRVEVSIQEFRRHEPDHLLDNENKLEFRAESSFTLTSGNETM
jgi:hypothetical protein